MGIDVRLSSVTVLTFVATEIAKTELVDVNIEVLVVLKSTNVYCVRVLV
jgi:hypothetical protein